MIKGVLRLCKDAMKSKSSTATWDWLFVLPICHFLSGSWEPFASPKLYPVPNDFFGRAKEFGYDDVLRKKSLRGYILYSTLIRDKGVCMYLFTRLVAQNSDILKSLFTVDPILIFDVIYLCPDEEFSTLCSIVPACLSLKWLSFQEVKMLKDFVSFISILYALDGQSVLI